MAKISKKDKHFWKIISLFLCILNITLLTILIGLIYEEKIYENKIISLEENLYSRNIKETYYGNSDANVTITIYSDFECPYCKRFHNKNYQKLQEEYINTGKAKIIFRHFPKTIIHKSALLKAEAFECAKEQDKSYEIYPYLFSEKHLSETELLHIAQQLNIKIPQFEECLFLEKYKNDILTQKTKAEQNNIKTTPTVIINGNKIEGIKPYSLYKQIIDEELGIYKTTK
jgi:protein-disulfide isomerase